MPVGAHDRPQNYKSNDHIEMFSRTASLQLYMLQKAVTPGNMHETCNLCITGKQSMQCISRLYY